MVILANCLTLLISALLGSPKNPCGFVCWALGDLTPPVCSLAAVRNWSMEHQSFDIPIELRVLDLCLGPRFLDVAWCCHEQLEKLKLGCSESENAHTSVRLGCMWIQHGYHGCPWMKFGFTPQMHEHLPRQQCGVEFLWWEWLSHGSISNARHIHFTDFQRFVGCSIRDI